MPVFFCFEFAAQIFYCHAIPAVFTLAFENELSGKFS